MKIRTVTESYLRMPTGASFSPGDQFSPEEPTIHGTHEAAPEIQAPRTTWAHNGIAVEINVFSTPVRSNKTTSRNGWCNRISKLPRKRLLVRIGTKITDSIRHATFIAREQLGGDQRHFSHLFGESRAGSKDKVAQRHRQNNPCADALH